MKQGFIVLHKCRQPILLLFFFFNDTATTEIYTLSLHDALPICRARYRGCSIGRTTRRRHWATPTSPPNTSCWAWWRRRDRKSTRLNSSHGYISYAVFCLKKKKKMIQICSAQRLTVYNK